MPFSRDLLAVAREVFSGAIAAMKDHFGMEERVPFRVIVVFYPGWDRWTTTVENVAEDEL